MPAPATSLESATLEVADSMEQCAERLRGSESKGFQSVLKLLFKTASLPRSKYVFTGVGKSYLIAKKLSATLTSVGSPSTCLHSTEALHGDLGIIHPGDCVIALSYSGNTEEVIRLVSVLRDMRAEESRDVGRSSSVGISIVGMGRSADSPLGRLCDAWIDSSVDGELSPSVNAPTSSSSVMLAIGDAIAMLLMNHKQFGPQDFARNHPGGHLGRVSRALAQQQQQQQGGYAATEDGLPSYTSSS
ncbi:SIS domain-containing protein [Martensiomyces pterosporus]|nr:SIS domain-containing protein [Martensiomyces pterosporus]